MIGVVLDTNVVVSANLKADGLEAWVVSLALNRKMEFYVSEPLLEEYERVLLYPRLGLKEPEVRRFMTLLRRVGTLVKPTRKVTASPDEADNRFLECAEAAKAQFLVTGNKRHFPKSWKGTQVVNASELLGAISVGRAA